MTAAARVPVAVRRLHPDAGVPAYSTDGDAGADLTSVAEVTLAPGERALVPTGIAARAARRAPSGWCTRGPASPRATASPWSTRPGTVDSGYRGEILVNLVNLDPREPFTVRVGDRIAQLVVQHYLHADFDVTDSLPDSARGETGHGSTGGFGPADPR